MVGIDYIRAGQGVHRLVGGINIPVELLELGVIEELEGGVAIPDILQEGPVGEASDGGGGGGVDILGGDGQLHPRSEFVCGEAEALPAVAEEHLILNHAISALESDSVDNAILVGSRNMSRFPWV